MIGGEVNPPLFSDSCGRISGLYERRVLPPSLYEGVEKIAREVLTQPNRFIEFFCFLSALWSFSKSEKYLQSFYNKLWRRKESWRLIPSKMLSLLVSFGLQLLFAFALFLILFGQMILFILALLDKRWHYLSGFTRVGRSSDLRPPLCAILVMLYFSSQSISKEKISYPKPGSAFVLLVILVTNSVL